MRKALTFIFFIVFYPQNLWAVKADVLAYRVQESGSEPYTSRFLVTPRWLRLDQGEGTDGYLLYDREKQIIHDVSDADRTVLEIDAPAGRRGGQPAGLRLSVTPVAEPGGPSIRGIKPRHYRLRVNGKDCQEIVVLPDAMSNAVGAWREFSSRLADQQWTTLANMPAGSQSECDLVTHVYAPNRGLSLGLPVYWHIPDKDRALQNYASGRHVADALFTLPKGYRRIGLPTAGERHPSRKDTSIQGDSRP